MTLRESFIALRIVINQSRSVRSFCIFVGNFRFMLATFFSNVTNMFKRPGFLLGQSSRRLLSKVDSTTSEYEWTLPKGYDTGIKVYCRKVDKLVPLILQNKHLVKWYICGPTVYDVSHIGHASCYIRFDIISRILREFFDIKPIIALGITDIDDKIIKAANKRSVEFTEIAKQYELDFFSNLNKLNILPPAFVLRVTEHIPEIIEFISKIINKGDAYVAVEDGSVYFHMPESDIPPNPNTKDKTLNPGQKNAADFALWKGVKPGEPFWESPWGKGRPGWHIECSAMASKVFGSQLDLHGGGIDLRFPHHTNEEFQSCSYHGCKQWVNYWLHVGQVEVPDKWQNQKMSKSLNNFVSVSDFLNMYTPDNLRMYCFMSKYDRALHYGSNSMTLPVNMCNLINRFLADCKAYVSGNWCRGNISESALLQDLEETCKKVRQHLGTDFDTGQCHIALLELVRKTIALLGDEPDVSSSRCPAAVHAVSEYVSNVYRSLGFHLKPAELTQLNPDDRQLEFILKEVVGFRSRVRGEALQSAEKSVRENLLAACDCLRKELATVGVIIKDGGKDKSSWTLMEPQRK